MLGVCLVLLVVLLLLKPVLLKLLYTGLTLPFELVVLLGDALSLNLR